MPPLLPLPLPLPLPLRLRLLLTLVVVLSGAARRGVRGSLSVVGVVGVPRVALVTVPAWERDERGEDYKGV